MSRTEPEVVRVAISVNDSAASLGALAKLLPRELGCPVVLDLRDCGYLGPMALSVLSAYIVAVRDAGSRCSVVPPAMERLRNYCVYAGFAQLAGFGPAPTDSSSNETIPSRLFADRDQTGVQLVCALVQRHIPLTHHAQNVLAAVVGEMTQNVADHAHGAGVLSARFLARQRVVRVCVADRGLGLRAALASKYEVADDRRAVQLALERGVTSESTRHNRGQGLNLLDHVIEFNRGRLVVASGVAYYERSATHCGFRVVEEAKRVPGTVCFFQFNTSNELYPDDEADGDLW